MFKFIENNFFLIVHRIGFLFALISLALIVFLGVFSYEKLSSRATDEISAPSIELAKYQNPISLQVETEKASQAVSVVEDDSQVVFNQKFDTQIEQIITNLQALPNEVLDENDLQFQIKVMIKIKSNAYSPELKLSYVESLSRLTKQLVNVGGDQVNIDEFLHWHDQEFAYQVNEQTQQNLMKMGTARTDQMTGFISLGMLGAALGFFIMFVMMLVMLRIERNTRR
ncbi:hypothetical protein [Candidatus Thioglobus sp.]|jgi:Fe2+ transport system protein B|uniref:hypothetical protein n=1 Tax=Candidatus Thioglobus sp. TaxID=2026721 RepID=UPI001DB0C0AE|nr:hypothetical protein [Candidatus Thioglobus sp.]MBT3277717.1 hypothetical protein [Candidatus Thioglobus sp.]MBT3446739.1 hypothetical protein [Candidatus Thioglobus sp.]MBT4000952.1 hypothetical protein [Candidatus Thioglobus sp.]MBT4182347.1 hypothetical protein [Candidatus Thioglobus sp.]MBT4747124.1 hypothetical protein [Candidatus Thioglobus sp.]